MSWKPDTGRARVKYAEAVEEALCVGWIDGGVRTIDAERTMLWLTKRRPGSRWSALNKSRVAQLERAGLMREAGRAAIAAAQRDGSWQAFDAVEAMVVPDDLERALAANAAAARHFAAFPKSVRKPLLAWVGDAKRAETRAARIAELVRRSARNECPPYRMT
ncbi:MAG TPA: YdeI/OmpD-associated family protein [Xanthomonadales bacterium]|nr:YdeI/OmpD-associated family protein [Xanthomonadales bacterium]